MEGHAWIHPFVANTHFHMTLEIPRALDPRFFFAMRHLARMKSCGAVGQAKFDAH